MTHQSRVRHPREAADARERSVLPVGSVRPPLTMVRRSRAKYEMSVLWAALLLLVAILDANAQTRTEVFPALEYRFSGDIGCDERCEAAVARSPQAVCDYWTAPYGSELLQT